MLHKKQSRFALCVAQLIIFARAKGYDVTFGDAYRDPRVQYGHEKSCHRKRLAVDLNLFRGGRYLQETEHHKFLGDFWESLDLQARWGGRFGDGNHYSFEHEGVQ